MYVWWKLYLIHTCISESAYIHVFICVDLTIHVYDFIYGNVRRVYVCMVEEAVSYTHAHILISIYIYVYICADYRYVFKIVHIYSVYMCILYISMYTCIYMCWPYTCMFLYMEMYNGCMYVRWWRRISYTYVHIWISIYTCIYMGWLYTCMFLYMEMYDGCMYVWWGRLYLIHACISESVNIHVYICVDCKRVCFYKWKCTTVYIRMAQEAISYTCVHIWIRIYTWIYMCWQYTCMFWYMEMYDGHKGAWRRMPSTYAYMGETACHLYVSYICVYTYQYVYMYTQVLTTHMHVFIYGSIWRAQRSLADNAVHICIYGGGHMLYICMLHICIYISVCIYVYASIDYTHVFFDIWKYMKGAKKLGGWFRPRMHIGGRPHVIYMYVLYTCIYISVCIYVYASIYYTHVFFYIWKYMKGAKKLGG